MLHSSDYRRPEPLTGKRVMIVGGGDSAVQIACGGSAGRSQTAAALAAVRGAGRVHARSAGTAPAAELELPIVQAMEETGADLSPEFPKPLTDELAAAADLAVTLGCGGARPVFPGKRYLDWKLDDPAGQGLDAVRPIRNEICRRVESLIAELRSAGG